MARKEKEARSGLMAGRFWRGLTLALLAVCAALALFILVTRGGGQETEPVITATLLSQQLRDVQELATVEYHYTNMGRFENNVDFYGWKVPFTTKSFIVSYDGVIKAGVDLSSLDIRVDQDGSRVQVSVTLPEAGILSHEILEDTLQVFDESKNIFNPITIEDYTSFTADQKGAMEERAVTNGLLAEAGDRAALVVHSLLSQLLDAYAEAGIEYTLNVE